MPLHRYLLNGVVVTAAIFTLQVLVALPAAYALAKLRFGLAKPLFALVLLGLLIPGHVPAIPHYIMLSHAGLLNTYPALVLPSIISVFGIFWIRQFFRTVPDDLIHAARLDGLSRVLDRLAHHAARRHAGAGRLRHPVGGVPLERLFLAAAGRHLARHGDAGARARSICATPKPAPTTAR